MGQWRWLQVEGREGGEQGHFGCQLRLNEIPAESRKNYNRFDITHRRRGEERGDELVVGINQGSVEVGVDGRLHIGDIVGNVCCHISSRK